MARKKIYNSTWVKKKAVDTIKALEENYIEPDEANAIANLLSKISYADQIELKQNETRLDELIIALRTKDTSKLEVILNGKY